MRHDTRNRGAAAPGDMLPEAGKFPSPGRKPDHPLLPRMIAAFPGTVILLLCVVLSILPRAAEAQGPSPKEPFPLRICIHGRPRTIHDLGIICGRNWGTFVKHGLKPEYVLASGAVNMVAGLLNGEIHIAHARGEAVAAMAEGADLVLVGIVSPGVPYYFVTGPETNSPKDLAGKQIVLTNESGTPGTNRFFLERMGLGEGDVSVLTIQNTSERLAALESKAVAGVLLTPPSAQVAMELGFRSLFDFTGMENSFPNTITGILTTRSFLRDHPHAVEAYIRGLSEATFRMRTDREGTLEAMAEHFSLDRKAHGKALEEICDSVIRQSLPVIPWICRETARRQIEFVARSNPAAASLSVEQVYDEGPLRALERAGFFEGFRGRDPLQRGE